MPFDFFSWYTDVVDVWRNQPITTNGLTTNKTVEMYKSIPCRIFQSSDKAIKFTQQASEINDEKYLACDNNVDIKPGDMLLITRGGALGKETPVMRCYAESPEYFFEPFDNAMPGLAHQEIRLLEQERVD